MKNRLFTLSLFLLCLSCMTAMAKANKSNSTEARQMFNKVYNSVFGNEGSSLTYSVNIIGLYKTEGDVIYKGKKFYFEDKRLYTWCDGTTAYKVNKKERTVEIFRADDDSRDKHMAKFKFDQNNFTYEYKAKGNTYEITAKAKNSSMMGIKHIIAVVNKTTLHPISLKIKVAFLTTTVKISNFKAGNIPDKVFVFPKSRFAGYKFTDKR